MLQSKETMVLPMATISILVFQNNGTWAMLHCRPLSGVEPSLFCSNIFEWMQAK